MRAREQAEPGQGRAAMWYALFGGPVAWFTGLCAAYFMVSPSCDARSELALHLISLVTLLAAAGAVLAGFVSWRSVHGQWPDDRGGRIDRTRFVSGIGMLIGGLFAVVILAQWAAAVVHQPCWQLPRLPDSPDAFVQPVEPVLASRTATRQEH